MKKRYFKHLIYINRVFFNVIILILITNYGMIKMRNYINMYSDYFAKYSDNRTALFVKNTSSLFTCSVLNTVFNMVSQL